MKWFVVLLVRGAGFGVDRGVFVAKSVVSLCCEVRFPIEVKHFCFGVVILLLDEGRSGRIEVIGSACKNNDLLLTIHGFSN